MTKLAEQDQEVVDSHLSSAIYHLEMLRQTVGGGFYSLDDDALVEATVLLKRLKDRVC